MRLVPVAAAIIPAVATIGGGVLAASSAKSAANQAAAAQTAASQASIAEQRRQYDQTRSDLLPWMQGGGKANNALLTLLGLGGGTAGTAATPAAQDWAGYINANPDIQNYYNSTPQVQQMFGSPEAYAQWHYQNYGQNEGRQVPMSGGAAGVPGQTGAQAQQSAIDQLKDSPLYQSLFNNGKDAILANASATGGLRGGNTNTSLANFGRDTLASVIQQQVSNLSGVSNAGEGAAAQTGQFGAGAANSIQQALTQQGQAQAGAATATGAANASMWNTIAGQIGGLANNTSVQGALAKLF